MSLFLETALSFPTVVLTVAVLMTVGFWLLSLLTGLGDALDVDLDLGDAGTPDGPLGSVLGGLHLTGVPPVVVLSLTATFAWLVSYVLSLLLGLGDASGPAAVAGGIGLLVGALVAGLLAASVVARPIARLFASTSATRSADLVGRTCTVRTGSVTPDFGQAEVAMPDGAVLLVQVRAPVPNAFGAGTTALLVDHDAAAGTFAIAPDELAGLDDPDAARAP